MTHSVETPFAIGQELWAPASYPEKVRVSCPVCFGTLAVIVEMGDGERVGVPCEACGKGYQGPQGFVEEWEYTPSARKFVVAGVKSMHDTRWWLVSEDGQERGFHELYPTEAEALAVSQQQSAEHHERNMQTRQRKRKDTKEATWSVRYHRDNIKDLERQIAWHQSRISAKRVKGPTQETKE